MKFLAALAHPVEDFKAFRRGERRVAPGMRGRVYERKGKPISPDDIRRSGHAGKLKVGAVVTRADGSKEHYEIRNGVPVRVDQSWLKRLWLRIKKGVTRG